MSDAVAIQLITATIALVGTVFSGIMAYLMARLNVRAKAAEVKADMVADKADAVAVRVADVKTALDENSHAIDAKLDIVHKKVNSAMSTQLRVVAELSRWKAIQTGDPIDQDAAVQADQSYRASLVGDGVDVWPVKS